MSSPPFSLLHRFAAVVFVPAAFLLLMLTSGCSREQHPELRQADSTYALARQAIGNGSIHEGRRLLLAAATLDEKHNRLGQLGEEFRLLAGIAISTAEFDSAFFYLDKSLEQFRSLAERPLVRSVTLDIISLHRLMGNERKAFTMCTEAIRLANVFGDVQGVREIQWAMLPACRALDEVEEEGRIINDLLKAYTTSGDVGSQARVYFETGLSKLHRNDHDGAVDDFLRTLTLAGQSGDSLLAIAALARLAHAYERTGKTTEAFQTYTDALQRTDVTRNAGRLRDEMLMRVGNIYLRAGTAQEAARFYRAALPTSIRMGNKLAEGYLFIQLGHCEVSDEEAMKKYQAALEMFTALASGRGIAYAELSLGMALWKRNQLGEAQSHLVSAVQTLEDLVYVPAVDDVYRECEDAFTQSVGLPAYDALIELLLHMGKQEEAFLYLQRRDGRRMYGILGVLDIHAPDQRLTTLLAEVRRWRSLRLGAETRLDLLLSQGSFHKEILDVLQTQLTTSAAGLADAATHVVHANSAFTPAVRISPLSVADAQRRLPAGAVLIAPFPATRTLHLFALTSTGLSVQVAAIEKGRVLSTSREFIEGLQQREAIPDSLEYEQQEVEQRVRSLSPVLYSWFVRPVESSLTGASKVLVVMPQELTSFPLHSLCKTVGRLASPYLIEQQQVNYLPLVFALAIEGKSVAPSRDIVGLGHPGRTSWDVEYELRDIRAFFKDARLYFQQQATLAALQGERGDVFHLAAEVEFSERAADNSFVMLSDGKSPATFRQVRWGQLFSLPPFPTIIVSNLVERRSGIEAALPMILLMNGTGGAGLTSYDPARKTRKFFGEMFYTTLLAGATGQQAFRQVQLEMIKEKEYSSPHVWAPFFLWGK